MHGSAGIGFEPGQWVRLTKQPDWGQGQVQSVVGDRVTVNFENAGKVLVNVRVVALESCDYQTMPTTEQVSHRDALPSAVPMTTFIPPPKGYTAR
jgi:hypothetical protein